MRAHLQNGDAVCVRVIIPPSKLTDRRPLTHEESKTPRRKSQAQTAVRHEQRHCSATCSFHHKISGPVSPGQPRRPALPLRSKRNREIGEIHEKKSVPVRAERTGESTEGNKGNEDVSRTFVLLVSFCSKPPGTRASARNERKGQRREPAAPDVEFVS